MNNTQRIGVWSSVRNNHVGLSITLATTFGCGAGVPEVSLDGGSVAAAIVAECDIDGNGVLRAAELKSYPSIAGAFAAYDQDRDQALSSEEIARRLGQLYNSSASLTGVRCTVMSGGRPLEGAKVVLRPPSILGESVKAAEGTTDATGAARPSLPAADLPERVRGAALMCPGLYHVEITHPRQNLPPKYNAKTELGCEIDPTVREGTSVTFDLKP